MSIPADRAHGAARNSPWRLVLSHSRVTLPLISSNPPQLGRPARQRKLVATVYFVYVSRKHIPMKIRSFIDYMVETVARLPEPMPPAPP